MVRVGIFFGGSAREREVSFAGGRTVYDNLDRLLFLPVPVFVDSWGRFILLDWQHLYKGTIRDFYPPPTYSGEDFYTDSSKDPVLLDTVGRLLSPEMLRSEIDLAFLILHGPRGEDGSIQGLLTWYGIPYVGSGVYASALGIDKRQQRRLMSVAGFSLPTYVAVERKAWLHLDRQAQLLDQIQSTFATKHCVAKPANEGSSIGVSIVDADNRAQLRRAIHTAFFIAEVDLSKWRNSSESERNLQIDNLCDLRKGPGLPLLLHESASELALPREGKPIRTVAALRQAFEAAAEQLTYLYLQGTHSEYEVLVEAYIEGREFSCILIEKESGEPIALPPTEIRSHSWYDYRAKYLPGISRKLTPMLLSEEEWRKVRTACESLYRLFGCEVYARLDGFLTPTSEVILNDPNTSSGMLPSSFLFHQAAEVGLSPTALLSYLLHRSLQLRVRKEKMPNSYEELLLRLESKLRGVASAVEKKIKVAVLTGGASAERHIAVESARNVYEKLASSAEYLPFPVFLLGQVATSPMYELPLSFLLKDNADDIAHSLVSEVSVPPWLAKIRSTVAPICARYGSRLLTEAVPTSYGQLSKEVDVLFLALHGRPGEDGSVQEEASAVGMPYNGSSPRSAHITIDKYKTAAKLSAADFATPKQFLLSQDVLMREGVRLWQRAEEQLGYPMVAKPVDEGCSAAVCKIERPEQLQAYAKAIFEELTQEEINVLGLAEETDFPKKDRFLLESCVTAEDADRFLEVSVGLLEQVGSVRYKVFPPSEVLVRGEILSLEEKFLAGEGQNITPAHFSDEPSLQASLSKQVQTVIARAAQVLDISGYARVDAFVRIRGEKAEVIIIEVNSLPGLTPATCLFHQAALAGYTPYGLLSAILVQAAAQKQRVH